MPLAVAASLAWAHPLVQEWFTARFSTPTEPQEQGWPHILAGHTTLISAPTGSGKTLAAFLACIDRLVRKALAGDLRDRTEVLYVSPLKALGNDIQKNLEIPLGEILQMAGERGLLMPEIRTAVRTGDTLAKDRRLMLKRPPHILVTTPESLYILLTAEKSRAILRDVETLIVDEIHAVVDDKRGVHLALSIERLEALRREAVGLGEPGPQGLKPGESFGLDTARLEGAAEKVAVVTSAAKADIEDEAVIAALKRCATQKQTGERVFQQTVTPGESFGLKTARLEEAAEEVGIQQPAPEGAFDFEGLAVSLKRYPDTKPPLVRIGLSATQKPIEEVARFLAGCSDAQRTRPDPVIVNIGHKRTLDLGVEVPASELGPVASNEMWGEIYERIVQLVNQHRSTLVFVNTRRMAERMAHQLGELLGEENVAAHHGSLSRKLRLAAEKKLKEGQIKVLVATASLELGIDVGTVDLVCHINSPRSIAVALQRVGRSGHWRGAVPKGRFFVTTRDDLAECAVLVRAIRSGELDRLIFPECSLDVLAQQIVACCAVASKPPGALSTGEPVSSRHHRRGQDAPATAGEDAGATKSGATENAGWVEAGATSAGVSGDGWDEDELFALVKRAYPYRNLSRETFADVLEMLSEGIASQRGRYGAYLHHDRINRRLRARRGARLAAITSGGAIPDNALFTVVAEPDGAVVGTVDEDFATESMAGEVMLLGNTSWRIRRIEGRSSRILVEDAHGAPPGIPFWRGEAPARTAELSAQLGELRKEISDRLAGVIPVEGWRNLPVVAEVVGWLGEECGLDQAGAEQLIQYVLEGRAVLGDVPTQTTIIAERFFDEGGGMQLIIHAPFGGRINKAWGLALRKRFCRGFNFELQAAATDNGLNIALAEQHSFPLADVFHFLHSESMPPILEQAALASPIFQTRWRWDATRALALLRFQGGKKVPPQIQRIRSDDLLASVFPDVAACFENIEGDIKVPDHPLVSEVMKDVLTEAMDIDGLRDVLRGIEEGRIRCLAVDTPVPSQFSHEILNANPYAFLDDAPLEERRARAVEMRRMLPASVLEEVGALDAAAIAQVQAEAWPDVRDADELHDVLHTLVAVKSSGQWPVGSGQQDSSQFSVLSSQEGGPQVSGLRSQGSSSQFSVFSSQDEGLELAARGSQPVAHWDRFFERLLLSNRAVVAEVAGAKYWVAAERVGLLRVMHPDGRLVETRLAVSLATNQSAGDATRDAASGVSTVTLEDAILTAVQGWMAHLGPTTAAELGEWLGVDALQVEKALLRMEASGAILRGKFRADASRGSLGTDGPEARPHTGPGTGDHEWCERRLLARIHRLTVATLRKQIEPVMAAQFMNWLLHWQHLAPGTQVRGEHGTFEVIRQLQGFEIPASAWERFVLGRRITAYDPAHLDQLCLAGAVGWGRLSPHPATLDAGNAAADQVAASPAEEGSASDGRAGAPVAPFPHRRRVIPTRVAPIAFFVREDADWMRPHHPGAEDSQTSYLSPVARELLELLKQRGALFFPDMVRATARLKAEVETGLWELVAAGLVTADGFENLRSLVTPKNLAGSTGVAGLRMAKVRRPRHAPGRWSLLYTDGSADRDRSVESCCWMLLRRYGVVFRDLLARETNLPRWRELQIAFRRLEDRGEVRGGRFVSGFLGEQFALPVAVESLRANRKAPMSGERIVIAAADPLNLVGIIVPGERIPAISGRSVAFRDGVWDPDGEIAAAARP